MKKTADYPTWHKMHVIYKAARIQYLVFVIFALITAPIVTLSASAMPFGVSSIWLTLAFDLVSTNGWQFIIVTAVLSAVYLTLFFLSKKSGVCFIALLVLFCIDIFGSFVGFCLGNTAIDMIIHLLAVIFSAIDIYAMIYLKRLPIGLTATKTAASEYFASTKQETEM